MRATAASPGEITNALTELPDWEVLERKVGDADDVHIELHRLFQFSSFEEAMHFMLTASRFIHFSDHHPSWQNTYSKLEIWITTGELKHRLSSKDFKLARYLEELFARYRNPL